MTRMHESGAGRASPGPGAGPGPARPQVWAPGAVPGPAHPPGQGAGPGRIPLSRSEDTLLLAKHFLQGCGGSKKLGKLAEKKLLEYSWPGNIRQLRNVIESAVVLGQGAEIRPKDLVLPESRRDPKVGVSWEPISLQNLEERHIKRVLEHTGGNKKKAAEILGIERCTLYAKLKSYDDPGKKGEAK